MTHIFKPKVMKKFLVFLFLAALCFALPALAQDTTAVVEPTTTVIIPGWVTTLLACLVAVYELVIGYYPTVGNYSLIDFIIKVIRLIVPNRKAGGGTH
jgi:hypothetical protein